MTAGLAIPEAPTRAEELAPGALTGEIVPVTREIALPSQQEWRVLAHMANALAESGMLGRHLNGRAKAVMAVILKGRELALPPMEALNSIYIIEGVPTLSAHLMLALIRRAGHEVWYDLSTGERAVICGQRRRYDGSLGPVERVEWTYEMARAAGLLNKDNWKHYPDAMLRARAATALARMSFSDVLMGAVYTPEELGASVGADGSVMRLPNPQQAVAAAAALAEGDQGGAPPPQPPVPVEEDPESILTPDTIEGEPVEEAEPLDRVALWAELLDQARLAGQSYRAFTNRWARAHRKNIDDATTAELAEFVHERRSFVDDLVQANPAARDNVPTGPQPECPPDPETGEVVSGSAPSDEGEKGEVPASDQVEESGTPQVSDPEPVDEPAPAGTEPDDTEQPETVEPVDEDPRAELAAERAEPAGDDDSTQLPID